MGNEDLKQIVIEGLKHNLNKYGKTYCPCIPPYRYDEPNSDDYICQCKEYREQGICQCGLFENRN